MNENHNELPDSQSVTPAESNPNSEKFENKLVKALKSFGNLLGRGLLGVMSDEAPSGPPTEREKKALQLPDDVQNDRDSKTF